MDIHAIDINTITTPDGGESDYGSDFSPEVEQIVAQLLSAHDNDTTDDNPILRGVEQHEALQSLHVPRILGRGERSPLFQAVKAAEEVAEHVRHSVGQPTNLANKYSEILPDPAPKIPQELAANQIPDTRSPMERFRTQPKKALSVTDLISPAWCELQYWYTLTIHGKTRPTPAMKQGSAVHKKLEDQVHTTVKVEITTIEDAWGLRIWNIIQGLKTLRETGLTRELEIWGTIDGHVVCGIIDELSYISPDTELEDSLESSLSKDEPPPDQATISEFFKATGGSTLSEATRSKRRAQTKKVYLCDVKTRSVRNLPSGAAFRPTRMQLMLYHHLLSALATGTVDLSIFATRYNFDPLSVFSDSFIAQVGSLNDDVFYDAQSNLPSSQESDQNWSQDSMSILLAHNTLAALWTLMIQEFQITFPNGADSIGKVLQAEYRSRDEGEIIGSKTFAMDEGELKKYIDHEMEWWKGEREAEGVVIEEAYKCRTCEFAENCTWRLEKIEETTKKVRSRRKAAAT
ncbi:Uncharacterized protein BP5553_08181 [Venustampulla echinocandica]|uniref:Exonuclease V n=1 Tax=Venustampulla echinocandica TaxID=2656787 RepID=A0A370TFZ5_9HELO|nr:Uncharacterized protein BP5553_08181 [Venustampulla echinocandica]RDL33813.1 Uncharacterized protein BP5553_08181 [Venustampulla echinocandica]